jgi:23S rRNA (pseudouridine1915-N3)-methyltransferase
MKIVIAAVGRLKERHWRDAADEYLKRLRPYASIDAVEVPDQDLGGDEARAVRTEAEALARVIPENAYVVGLEIGGTARSSEAFSGWLAGHLHAGRQSVAFLIGGAAGLDPSLAERCDERLSLGPMTLPHQLARVVLLEQLYRAFRIMRNEPYHR